MRRNGCKPIRFTSAVLLGLVFSVPVRYGRRICEVLFMFKKQWKAVVLAKPVVLLLIFDCRSDLTDSDGFAHDTYRSRSVAARNQCLAHLSFSSRSLFNFSSFQRSEHDFAV